MVTILLGGRVEVIEGRARRHWRSFPFPLQVHSIEKGKGKQEVAFSEGPTGLVIGRLTMRVAARTVEHRLNADTSDHAGPTLLCTCGRPARYAGRRGKNFESVLGSLRLERAYYHCAVCEAGFCPRDRVLGLEGGSLSPGVLRMVGLVGAMVGFEEGHELLHELAVVDVPTKHIERVATRRGFDRAARQAVLGDGAKWIWNLADEHFPDAVQIVDRFHAKHHLSDVAKSIYGAGSGLAKQWAHDRHDELDAGDIEAVLNALRLHSPQDDEARKCVDYIERNGEHMRYPQFRAAGLCTSTGVVEAGCKVAIATVQTRRDALDRRRG